MTVRLALVCLIAACTGGDAKPGALPDHFDDHLDVLIRGVANPCAGVWHIATPPEPAIDINYTYTYDAQHRPLEDTAMYPSGNQDITDYAWDSVGHLVQIDNHTSATDEERTTMTYDTLERMLEFREETLANGAATSVVVLAYSDFDELGHPARAIQTIQKLQAGMTDTWTREYTWDELGRRTRTAIEVADGTLHYDNTWTYDEAARTVTYDFWIYPTPSSTSSGHSTTTDTYDAAYHLLAEHIVSGPLEGGVDLTTDVTHDWSGDRQLDVQTVSTRPDGTVTDTETFTYAYDCAR